MKAGSVIQFRIQIQTEDTPTSITYVVYSSQLQLQLHSMWLALNWMRDIYLTASADFLCPKRQITLPSIQSPTTPKQQNIISLLSSLSCFNHVTAKWFKYCLPLLRSSAAALAWLRPEFSTRLKSRLINRVILVTFFHPLRRLAHFCF